MTKNIVAFLGMFAFVLTLAFGAVPNAYAIDGAVIASLEYTFTSQWDLTFSEATPRLSAADSVVQKQYFYLYTVCGDVSTNSEGVAVVNGDFVMIKPDGEVYEEFHDIPMLENYFPEPEYVQLCGQVIKVCFEPEDKPGLYKIAMRLKDTQSGEVVELQTEITLVPFERAGFDGDIGEWMHLYHEDPEPIQALDVFLKWSNEEHSASSFTPMMSFFVEIFDNNRFLLPVMQDIYPQQTPSAQSYILFVMRQLEYDSSAFYTSLPEDDRRRTDSLYAGPFPSIDSEVVDPSGLDFLWGNFQASGAYEPIREIVNVLEQYRYGDMLQADVSLGMEIDETNPDTMRGLIHAAAVWSLQSNIEQDLLVREYCAYIHKTEALSYRAHTDLGKLLGY